MRRVASRRRCEREARIVHCSALDRERATSASRQDCNVNFLSKAFFSKSRTDRLSRGSLLDVSEFGGCPTRPSWMSGHCAGNRENLLNNEGTTFHPEQFPVWDKAQISIRHGTGSSSDLFPFTAPNQYAGGKEGSSRCTARGYPSQDRSHAREWMTIGVELEK